MYNKASPLLTDKQGWETWLFTGDEQAPFQDDRAVKLATRIIAGMSGELTGVCNLGDLIDFYTISAYDKNPLRRLSLTGELAVAHKILSGYRDALDSGGPGPDGKRKPYHATLGNHEHRLLIYMIKKAPELASLIIPGEVDPYITVSRLLQFEKLNVTGHYDQMKETTWEISQGVFVGHFDCARAGAANTARFLVEKRGVSVVQAHCHRQGLMFKRLMDGRQLFGMENASLCMAELGYVSSPDWQIGMSMLRINRKKGLVIPVPIPFVGYTANVEGQWYSA